MKIQLLTLAAREVDDAVEWYDQQSELLRQHFLDELDRAVRLVKSHPLIDPKRRQSRRAPKCLAADERG